MVLYLVFWFWYYAPVCPLFQFPLCVSPSLFIPFLRYLTCPFPSSLTSPVPDPLISVSVFSMRSLSLHSVILCLFLFVMFCSVSPIGTFWIFSCDLNFALFFSPCLVFSCYFVCCPLSSFFSQSPVFCTFQLVKIKLAFCFFFPPPILPPVCVCVWVHI